MDLKIDINESDAYCRRELKYFFQCFYFISKDLQYDFQEVINFPDNWLDDNLPNRAVLIKVNS